jgi:hypothetical protein
MRNDDKMRSNIFFEPENLASNSVQWQDVISQVTKFRLGQSIEAS